MLISRRDLEMTTVDFSLRDLKYKAEPTKERQLIRLLSVIVKSIYSYVSYRAMHPPKKILVILVILVPDISTEAFFNSYYKLIPAPSLISLAPVIFLKVQFRTFAMDYLSETTVKAP